MTVENSNAEKPEASPTKSDVKLVSKSAVATPAKTPVLAASKAIASPTRKAAAKPKATSPAIPAAKPANKPVAKPVAQVKLAAKTAIAKETKVKKPKMVRDSFTFPKAEYAVLDALKLRAAKLGSPVKKTELLRAGVKAIAAMQDAAFRVALRAVPSLKTGRPAKAKTD